MSLFPESSEQPSGKAVLLSIKPKYVDLILAGKKRIELRRNWPSNDIGVMVLYSSAPVQKLVGVAFIDHIEECNFESLWTLADANGGGVTYDELKDYIKGKKTAFGVLIDRVRIAEVQVDPKKLFPNFTPPQSFLYLDPVNFRGVMRAMFPSQESE
ncbi:MAG: ASCH domain-containing protein [Methylomicrobium sp.]